MHLGGRAWPHQNSRENHLESDCAEGRRASGSVHHRAGANPDQIGTSPLRGGAEVPERVVSAGVAVGRLWLNFDPFDMKAIDTKSSAQDEAKDELEICISCLKTNSPGTHFCRHCGTPLTSYAATAPFESIFAEGDFWRKAMKRAKESLSRRIAILLFLVLMILSILLGMMLPR